MKIIDFILNPATKNQIITGIVLGILLGVVMVFISTIELPKRSFEQNYYIENINRDIGESCIIKIGIIPNTVMQ